MTAWEIIGLLVCLGFLALVASLVPTINQLRKSAKELQDVTANLNEKLPDILTNLDDISRDVSSIVESGREHAESLGRAVNQVSGIVDDVAGFEKKVKRTIEPSLLDSLSTISAVSKAVHAFIHVMSNGKHTR